MAKFVQQKLNDEDAYSVGFSTMTMRPNGQSVEGAIDEINNALNNLIKKTDKISLNASGVGSISVSGLNCVVGLALMNGQWHMYNTAKIAYSNNTLTVDIGNEFANSNAVVYYI